MRSFLKSMASVVLASCFSVSGLTASAQTINLGASGSTQANVAPGFNCITHGGSQAVYLNVGSATNVMIDSWTITGDGSFSGGTGFTRTVAAYNTSTGYGKIRVTVNYYYDGALVQLYCAGGTTIPTCSGVPIPPQPVRTYGSKTIDFFQTFNTFPLPVGIPADYIVGPRCVSNTVGAVTYSITPIVTSDAQIQAGIGTDTYYWEVLPAPTGGIAYSAGDRSSITFTAPTSTYTVTALVGKCNAGISPANGSGSPNFTLPARKPITVTVEAPIAVALPVFPCVLTSTNTFQFTVTGQAGVGYTLQKPSTWTLDPFSPQQALSFSGAGSFTFKFNIDGSVGNVTLNATGGCSGAQSVTRTLYRTLGTNVTFQPTSCFTVLPTPVAAPVTLNNAPIGAMLTWTIPLGFSWTDPATGGLTYTATSGPLTLPAQLVTTSAAFLSLKAVTPGANGNVTVTVANTPENGCGTSATISTLTPIRATGPLLNGTTPCYFIFDGQNFASRTFTIKKDLSCTSAPAASTVTVVSGQLFSVNQTTGQETLLANGVSNSPAQASITFPEILTNPINTPIPNTRVRIVVRNTTPSVCLDATLVADYTYTNQPRPAPHNPGPVTYEATPAQLRAYPNPAGHALNVDMVLAEKGTVKLTLVDAAGRVRQTLTTDKMATTLDVRTLPTGIYSLRVELPSGKFLTQTVQVQH